MINKVTGGISRNLYDAFGAEYEIYTESIEQGLKEPCFLISCLNPSQEQILGKRYFRQIRFCIQYFPSKVNAKQQCNVITEKLFDCLEYIQMDQDTMRGTNMTCEVVDGVLNFFVNYNGYIYKARNKKEEMEELDVLSNVKG